MKNKNENGTNIGSKTDKMKNDPKTNTNKEQKTYIKKKRYHYKKGKERRKNKQQQQKTHEINIGTDKDSWGDKLKRTQEWPEVRKEQWK